MGITFLEINRLRDQFLIDGHETTRHALQFWLERANRVDETGPTRRRSATLPVAGGVTETGSSPDRWET